MDNGLPEVCARVAHYTNSAYSEAIGDSPAPSWEGMTEAQRSGCIAGAAHALNGGTPEELHELWLQSRKAEGWVYGPVKDFATKTSPCMVPYAMLPRAQQHKDAIFRGVVLGVAAEFNRLRYAAGLKKGE